ncbi:MAG: prepilin-type N-terminal cleavage/methylation domain-containing protein, partial [Elusimicrobiaceae bacterium]|nr:prepilin-type N-terminal cleavage/methylation domain-containing protein [Elusimicrobiaceae bacterium]
KNKKQKGFTLLEILVVVVIIGVLTYLSVPLYHKIVQKADVSDALHNIDMLSGAQSKYYISNGSYASSLGGLETPLKVDGDNIRTTNFTYYVGKPGEDDYCIYAESNAKDYVLAKNYKTHSNILCSGGDCNKIESIIKEGDINGLCSGNNACNLTSCPQGEVLNPVKCLCEKECNKTEESCKKLNGKWVLLDGCTCGCTVKEGEEKWCNKSQRWSEEECDCVQWNSCELTEDDCKTLYSSNYTLSINDDGSCKCVCGLDKETCQSNGGIFAATKCSCGCSTDVIKKCAEQGKVLHEDCSCTCKVHSKCLQGYVFNNETCSCEKTDCTITEDDCKKKNENWVLLEDCSCGCDKLEVKECKDGYYFDKDKCTCIKKDCELTEEQCKKENENWVLKSNCVCGCEKVESCGTGSFWNSTKCVCEKKECDKTDDYCKKYFGEDYSLNEEKCDCVKSECNKAEEECVKEFGKYFILNKQTCSCECGLTEEKCKNEGGTLNKEKCMCEQTGCTKTEEECKKMNENYILDTSACNCKCGLVERDCTSQGMTFNSSKCKCDKIGCGITAEQCHGVNPNWTLLSDCTCGCPNTIICKDGTTWNADKCECQKSDCDKTEESCKKFNRNWTVLPDCTCGCPTIAHCTTPGEVWNAETCLCEKNSCNGLTDADCKAQNPNFYLEGTKCRCLCGVDKFSCGLQGLWYNIDTCECVQQ